MRRSLNVCVAAMVLLLALPMSVEAGSRMYWTDPGLSTIKRANLDGTGVEDLITTGLSGLQGIALDVAAGKMYWVEVGSSKIRRANLDGTGVEDLVGSVGPSAIALDLVAGKMYWTDVFITGKIQRANLDGSGVEDVITFGSDRAGIALDVAGGKMYLTNRSFGIIERANLDGTGVETLVTGLVDPREIALDVAAGKMYWAHLRLPPAIQRANLDGTGVETLVTGLVSPHGMALDLASGKMYWTDFAEGGVDKIQRANLDGSGVEDLITGLPVLFNPFGIALELEGTLALELKQDAITELEAVRAAVLAEALAGGDVVDALSHLDAAIAFCQASLPSFQAGDGNRLTVIPTLPDGTGFFDNEENCVEEIFDAIGTGQIMNTTLLIELENIVVDKLLEADKIVAQTAIDDAVTGIPVFIAKAEAEFAKAEQQVANRVVVCIGAQMFIEEAVESFEDAWINAQRAVGALP